MEEDVCMDNIPKATFNVCSAHILRPNNSGEEKKQARNMPQRLYINLQSISKECIWTKKSYKQPLGKHTTRKICSNTHHSQKLRTNDDEVL